ncbi:MAG TPA: AsmA-like C-terminal region-containing protein [Candidatus Scalindua sp.]|nr:AsmA-like C-terminal region-containing protein [Candidatus Scalindua sp.]
MSRSKVSLILIIIFSVIGCILIGGYFTLKTFTSEKAIKTRITERLEALTGGKLTVEHAHFDMFKGLNLSNFKFEGKDPENLRIEGESILIRHEPLALLRGEVLINSIMIVSPELFLVREKGAIWRFLNGVKAMLDHSGIKYPTDQLGRGVIVKAANVHVYDEVIFRGGVLNIENVDLFGQQLGGSLKDIHIKGIINDGLWKGLELNVDTNLATPELKLVAQTRDKTMTEELMKELPVIGEKFWKTYSPTGKFNFDCTLDFNDKDSKRKMDYLLKLDVIDGEMTYIKWPFLIKHVNGKLEFSRKGTFLKSMKGDLQNEGQQTHGEIDAFFAVGDARKSVNLNIPNFNITETLMKMIPDVGEKVWNDYHPKGNIDLTIKYESNEDKSVTDYSAKASCKGITAENPFIPYDISNIIGLIENDGKNIYLKNMSGYLQNGQKTNHCMIDGVISPKSKEKRFIVSIPNLDLREEVVKSIPKKGEDIWSRYKPTGQVDFMLNYRGFEDSSKDEYVITVDGKGNEIKYADLSIELKDVIGRVIVSKNDVQLKNLRGYMINGDKLARTVGNGVYKLRSEDKKTLFNVFDLTVTEEYLDKFPKLLKRDWFKIEPVGWVNVTLDDEVNDVDGKDRHSVIIDTKGCKAGLTNIPVTISDIEGRINVEGGQLTGRNMNGTYCGGRINGTIEADRTSPDGEYSGKLNFEKVSLQKMMESFVKEEQKWTGVCEGNIDLQGKGKDLKDFTAKGSVRLQEGQLAEVPVLLSILKLLNLSLPKKESFHTAKLKYSVKDKIINIEELEVFSDSVELGCIGTVGFDSTVDLTVVAGLNKETFSQIPFIGGLMDFVVGGVRKKLTKVQITGTLTEPKSAMIGLKPLTYPIKRIFDVLSPARENKEEDGEKNKIKTKAGKKAKS